MISLSNGTAAQAASQSDLLLTGSLVSVELQSNVGQGSVHVYLLPAGTGSGNETSLAHDVVDASGRFSFDVGAEKAASAQPPNSMGWQNFIVFAALSGDRFSVQYISRRHEAGRWVTPDRKPAAESPTTLSVSHEAIGARPGTRHARLMGDLLKQQAPSELTDEVTLTSAPTEIYRNTMTRVGRVEASPNTKASFSYGKTSDSSIEVGVKGEAEHQWKASGTHHVGTSAGSEVTYVLQAITPRPKFGGHAAHIMAGFDYGDFFKCVSGWYCWSERSAIAWTGALQGKSDDWHGCNWNDPCAPYTVCYDPAHTYTATKTQGQNKRYTGAAEIGNATTGMFTASATSGWSENVKIIWEYDRTLPGALGYQWCLYGENGWWTDAEEIYLQLAR
ncbi:hypothetical protein ACIBKY_49745 [Nonomuraea sp. NPDC050394]|uniref:hypothetical protein n=1 Tax=Nonomuraea sp. NPDC050394 TaxID=3364363 RepID=UPI0037B68C83